MSKSRNTSNSDIPKMYPVGTRPRIMPTLSNEESPSPSPADEPGNIGTPGSTCEGEEALKDIGTSNYKGDCDIEFLMADEFRHPVAIICTTHGWRGGIS